MKAKGQIHIYLSCSKTWLISWTLQHTVSIYVFISNIDNAGRNTIQEMAYQLRLILWLRLLMKIKEEFGKALNLEVLSVHREEGDAESDAERYLHIPEQAAEYS